jgi:hypothetical protein
MYSDDVTVMQDEEWWQVISILEVYLSVMGNELHSSHLNFQAYKCE